MTVLLKHELEPGTVMYLANFQHSESLRPEYCAKFMVGLKFIVKFGPDRAIE